MFIHFLHREILRFTGALSNERLGPSRVIKLVNALKWAYFLSDGRLIIPTVDLVQSPVANDPWVVRALRDLDAVGAIQFVGSSVSIDELSERKRVHFRDTENVQAEWAKDGWHDNIKRFGLSLARRATDATVGLAGRWSSTIGDDALWPGRQLSSAYWTPRSL